MLVVCVKGFHGGLEVLQVALCRAVVSLLPIGRELRDGDGGQDTDDRNNDQQLDEGEALVASEFTQHACFSFLIGSCMKIGISSVIGNTPMNFS